MTTFCCLKDCKELSYFRGFCRVHYAEFQASCETTKKRLPPDKFNHIPSKELPKVGTFEEEESASYVAPRKSDLNVKRVCRRCKKEMYNRALLCIPCTPYRGSLIHMDGNWIY